VSRDEPAKPDCGGTSAGVTRRGASVLTALLLTTTVALLLAGWTGEGPGTEGRPLDAIAAFATGAPFAALWIAAAMGFGRIVRRWLTPGASGSAPPGSAPPGSDAPDGATRLAIQAATGVAILLFLDGALGRLGALHAAGGLGGWLVLAVGIGLLAWPRPRGSSGSPERTPSRWLLVAAAPPVAVLLVAACSSPGWLWATEFGGYDALSYHLQLPKEWLALGRVTGLEHNVYSFHPSYVEAAYAHLVVLTGDGIRAGVACQLLHASLTVITAFVAGRAGRVIAGPAAGWLAGLLVIGTPWVIVTGSLAYDEMAATLMLAGGILVLLDEEMTTGRKAAAIGLLAGAACGAKLTSIGFVAAPLGLWLLIDTVPRRRIALAAGVAAATGGLVLVPYLLSNAVQTGNPVFPFATALFGAGHWTPGQAEIWARGHAPPAGLATRVAAGWNEWARFGLGPAPDDAGPWRAQWSTLPLLAVIGVVVGLASRRDRGIAGRLTLVLLTQLAFWLALTHIKSRFMLPSVVPAALLTMIAFAPLIRRQPGDGRRALLVGAAALLYGALPVVLFHRERGGAPAAALGATDVFTGDEHAARLDRAEAPSNEGLEVLRTAPPAFWINHGLTDQARVLCVGDAIPFYYRPANLAYQTTWDRGPMSRALREADDDARVIGSLRAAGFTHLLVDPTMLRIWQEKGWNDPAVTADRVLAIADDHATLLQRFPTGVALYALESFEP